MRLSVPHILALTALLAACERDATRRAPTPAPQPQTTNLSSDVGPPPEPWRLQGRLLGATDNHAIVLTDDIVSVDIASGEVTARAVTAAEDPVPTFERHLPRLGVESRDAQPVDRLTDLPIYVGGEVVVFMRGSDDVVTSLVGLDTTTLEEAWALEVAYRRPVRSCATDRGVLLVPPAPEPARFVDWLGQQAWLREFGSGELEEFRCGSDRVQVLAEVRKRHVLRTFDDNTGDLIEEDHAREPKLWLEPRSKIVVGVEQLGPDVVQVTSRN